MAKAPDLQLKVGDFAPAFTAITHEGNEVSLAQWMGKNAVLFFYPKDNTPGCNKEACGFRDAYDSFKEKNTIIVGVSPDSVKSHVQFVEQFSLPV